MGLLSRRAKLESYEVRVGGLTLKVHTVEALPDEARAIAMRHYEQVESYITKHPSFRSMDLPIPLREDIGGTVGAMAAASQTTGAGPLSALSGALAQGVAEDLRAMSKEVLVHCEGSSFGILLRPRRYLVDDSGEDVIAIRVESGTYAFHSSHGRTQIDRGVGKARAVSVLAEDGAIAAAASTAIASAMHRPQDIDRGLEAASRLPGLRGAVVLSGDRIGVWGEIELVGSGRDGDEG